MKISELIEELEKIKSENGDIDVMVNGYEGGYTEPGKIDIETLLYDYYNQWYYGKYESITSIDLNPEELEESKVKKAVCINRKLSIV